MSKEDSLSKDEKLKQSADSTVKSIEEMIVKIRCANEAIPMLNQAREIAKWNQRTIQALQTNKLAPVDDSLAATIYGIDAFWQALNNGEGTVADLRTPAASGLAMAGTGSVELYDVAFTYSNSNATKSLVEPLLFDFNKIQENQNTKGAVTTMLSALDVAIGSGFTESLVAIDQAMAGTKPFSQAAISMRNLLEHFNGRLYLRSTRARRARKPNKWNEMAKDLAKNGIGSFEYSTLLTEGSNHKQLHLELTKIAKRLATSTPRDFQVLSNKYVVHLLDVMNLLDPTRL